MAKKKRYLDENPPYATYQQPVDDGVVVPYNPNFVPTYNLPEISVAGSSLPKAKVTDANIQRYANAVANNQIKLTQIPDAELRNAVRAKPVVDKIREDTDKAGMQVGLPLLAAAALPMIGSVAGGEVLGTVGKYGMKGMNAVSNPFTTISTKLFNGAKTLNTARKLDKAYNSYLGLKGFYDAATENGIQKTIKKAKEGDVFGTLKSAAGDVLGIIGGTNTGLDIVKNLSNLRKYKGVNNLRRAGNYIYSKIPPLFKSRYELENPNNYSKVQANRLGYDIKEYKNHVRSKKDYANYAYNYAKQHGASEAEAIMEANIGADMLANTYSPVDEMITLDYDDFSLLPKKAPKTRESIDNYIGTHEMIHYKNDKLDQLESITRKQNNPTNNLFFKDPALNRDRIIPGFDYSHLHPDIKYYFDNGNHTEIDARIGQILNWYGMNGNQVITPKQVKYARKNYLRRGGLDNNMFEFLNSITDDNQFAYYINQNIGKRFKNGGSIKKYSIIN